MKKRLKRKRLSDVLQDEPTVVGLIGKVQQQLSAIEKKIDILIRQSVKNPFEKNYSQNSGRFNHSNRYDRGRQDNGPRERTYTQVICSDCNKECEVPFKPRGDRPVYCKECLPRHRKSNPFNANRDNRPEERDFPREDHPEKKQAKKRQRPAKKKKPFYQMIKKRTKRSR